MVTKRERTALTKDEFKAIWRDLEIEESVRVELPDDIMDLLRKGLNRRFVARFRRREEKLLDGFRAYIADRVLSREQAQYLTTMPKTS